MFTVALTGGIGSGKSTVADLFKQQGVTVIDADVIVHDISQPGKAGYHAITEHFGTEILQANGHIDRRKLRDYVFQHPLERQWLESLLHPLVRKEMMRQAAIATSPYCLLVIPLLTETLNFDGIDRVCVVDTPEALQIERTIARDHTTPEAVHKMMDAQNSREERLSYADDVIVNDGDRSALAEAVAKLHARYLTHR